MSENHTEHAQEHIHHEAAHGHGPRWITAAALTAALLAALAAVAGGQSSGHLTKSTHSRIEWSDKWAQYQSKSIKNYVLTSQEDLLKALKTEVPKGLMDKYAGNEADKKELAAKAEELGRVSDEHLEAHETFERATMMFHIAIAVVAIAVVAKRKEFWWMSMVGGAVGVYFFGAALTRAPAEAPEHEAGAAATAHVAGTVHATGEVGHGEVESMPASFTSGH